MTQQDFDRRRFNQLAAAAMGGMVAGSIVGCGGGDKPDADTSGGGDAGGGDGTQASADKHVCRGLNTCRGKGAKGENECAGQGQCATAKAHSCHGENECKGQGGCGETAGQNECQGKGECAVPLGDKTWTKARERFEAKMKEDGKEFAAAPPKPS